MEEGSLDALAEPYASKPIEDYKSSHFFSSFSFKPGSHHLAPASAPPSMSYLGHHIPCSQATLLPGSPGRLLHGSEADGPLETVGAFPLTKSLDG